MIAWMEYATAVTLLLALAAWLFDELVQRRGWPTRRLWGTVLLLVTVWPPLFYVVSQRPDGATLRVRPLATTAGAIATPATTAPAALRRVATLPALAPSARLERIALAVAIAGPVALLLLLLVEAVRLARVRRRWRAATIDGVPVMISKHFGPAVVGVRRPVIVMPEWSLDLPPDQRAMMLAHETEHLAAGDSWWIAGAFALVACTPWNPGMLWLLRRNRLALEIDCDRRVLHRGYEPAAYGLLLLDMTSRADHRSLFAAGMAARRSMLRSRIENLLPPGGAVRAHHVLRIIGGSAVFLGACFIGPSHRHDIAVAPVQATGVSHFRVLSPGVGDSIVTDEIRLTPTRAAHELPAVFRIDSQVTLASADNGCPSLLADGSTRLRLEASRTPDPHAPADATVGYYTVAPAGRYGVGKDEFLRIGCTRPTTTNLGRADATMATPMNVAIEAQFHIRLDTLERVGTRLNLSYVDSATTTEGSPRNHAMDVARYAWRQLGRDSMRTDTVTVNVDFPSGLGAVPLPGVTLQSVRWKFFRTRDLANR